MKTNLLILLGLFLGACNSSKVITTDVITEERMLDTLSVTADKIESFERPKYNPSYKRDNDLIHTKLEVSFDWDKQYLNGQATLDIKPLFYPVDAVRLDAKGFDIHSVELVNQKALKKLEYRYEDDKNLFIKLDRSYTSAEQYRLLIRYTAKPNELPIGGSQAITSDKGLYFINPLGKDKTKPMQIWTQGETESSSCWFPTIDRPNERCTQEILMKVQDRFNTLSNGILKSSTKDRSGMRVDHWVMDQAHAPYLFAMIVGEFAVVEEEWNGKLLQYLVEPEYEKDAKAIYKNTPEMLTFFSEKLGVPYPWPKYSQVVVRDYVSGAMENTTAVIFGDFIQMTERELIDNSDLNESIVAHEMMHHWFGDLVTCESWANLPMNESFANYSEYLWFEYKYGRDAADHGRKNQVAGYMNQAVMGGSMHPLIHYGYDDKEDMFDAHSYNKGGAILHMLRAYLGDEAFFAGLKKFLIDNSYSSVEAHNLRLAFEAVSGEDLNWFFNQWFFTKGHPDLEISKSYDKETEKLTIKLKQTQDASESTVFILPIDIEIFSEGSSIYKDRLWMDQQEQEFEIKLSSKPDWVAIDAARVILGSYKIEQDQEEWINQYYLSKSFQNRFEALNELSFNQEDPKVSQLFIKALDDKFWAIREKAIDDFELDANNTTAIEKLKLIAANDSRSQVRGAALNKLSGLNEEKYLDVAKSAIEKDPSYLVVSAALQAINVVNPQSGIQYAEKLMTEENGNIINAVGLIFSKVNDVKYLDFYKKNWNKTSNYATFSFFNNFSAYLKNLQDENIVKDLVPFFGAISMDKSTSQWARYASSNALKQLMDLYMANISRELAKLQVYLEKTSDESQSKFGTLLQQYMNDKSSENYTAIMDFTNGLKNVDAENVKTSLDILSQPSVYEDIRAKIIEIVEWEEDKMLSRLYRSWN